jgi:hypothetical protein
VTTELRNSVTDLRREFDALALDVAAGQVSHHHPDVVRLTGALWCWSELAPDAVCAALDLAAGSTYARCARQLRRRAGQLVTLF